MIRGAMGIFIQITVENSQITPDLARTLVRVCPVDIFVPDSSGDQAIVRPEQEDECIMCRMCLEAAPQGAVRILKTYTGETLISRQDD
jgi:Fe-S-cluster-containing hydrogenase component 2